MKKILFTSLSLALLLSSCGDDKPTAVVDPSSSGAALSSGGNISSGGSLSSGANGTSSSSTNNPGNEVISNFSIVDSIGKTWVAGTLYTSAFPNSVSGTFLRDDKPSNEANLVLNTPLTKYAIKPGVSSTEIPLSGELSLDAEVVFKDNACNGDYKLIITATVGDQTLIDTTAAYTQEFLNDCQ